MKKVLGTVGFVGLLGAGVVSGMGAGCPDKKECKGLVELTLETYKKEKPLTIPWFKEKFTVQDKGVAEKLQAQLMVDDPRIITKEIAQQITFTGKNEVTEGKEAVMITATYNKKEVGIYIKEDVAPLDVKVERVLKTYTEKKPLTIAWFKKEFDVKDDDATKRLRSQLKVKDPEVITDEVAKNITFTGKNKVTEGKKAVMITATYNKKDVGIYIKEDVAPPDVKTVRGDLAKYKKKEGALEVKGIGGKTAKDATATILAALQVFDRKFPSTVVFSSKEKLEEGVPTAVQATCKGDVTDFFVKAVPA